MKTLTFIITILTLITTLSTPFCANGNRSGTVEMFRFVFVEERGEWYIDLIADKPIPRPVAFVTRYFSLSTTGSLEILTPAVNGRIPPTVVTFPVFFPDGTLHLWFAADDHPSCLTGVPWIARFETKGEGSVTFAGEIVIAFSDGINKIFPVNITIDNILQLPTTTTATETVRTTATATTQPHTSTPAAYTTCAETTFTETAPESPAISDTTQPAPLDTHDTHDNAANPANINNTDNTNNIDIVSAPKGGVTLTLLPTFAAFAAAAFTAKLSRNNHNNHTH
jgi:hypothetical protein